jgi:(1->4)-alpha-D-glucan 1-alpha-D-glucosylmutase
MGIMGADNAWWLDVLENGPASAYGNFFDIDWEPINPDVRGKVLLPLLGEHYGVVLHRGELRLEFDAAKGEFSLLYYEHRLPVDPSTYPVIVGYRADILSAALGELQDHFIELQSLLTAFGRLPSRLDGDPARMGERQRDKEVHKRQLVTLCNACPDIAHHIAENLAEFNGRPNDPASFDLLHGLIRQQGYRLAYWRNASDEINYRRFFDINDLAALRMEEAAVFEATHRFILDLVAQGKVDGMRIDHPDGLYDPGRYFATLQERVQGRPLQPDEPPPLYLVIEKILADHEHLPEGWPIHGGTGYPFANQTNALFVDAAAERRMTRIYHDFLGGEIDFDALIYRSKKLIMDTALAGELNVLANRLARIAAAHRDTCDYTLNGLRDALAKIVASFPIYRTYVSAAGPSPDDRHHIEWAVAVAKKRSPAADASIFDFILSVLTTDIAQGANAEYADSVFGFAMKFQQYTAPVMAKGLEDTSFYRYHRLVSLNDVGGEPGRFGISPAAWHAATRIRAQRRPHNMLASSTHDSKRSEDVRARINVLSEMPAAWKLMVKHWSRINRARKRKIDDRPAPSANDEYLLYQTLIGTWPSGAPGAIDLDAYRSRILTYMTKAVREAKEHTSWVNINSDYESALTEFITPLLSSTENNLFLADFIPNASRIARFGLFNSLSQTLLKLASPGVPDIYQGCELWQFHLVDPDNRQPVDYAKRSAMLAELVQQFSGPPASWAAALASMTANMENDNLKQYLTWRTLQLRRRWPELFSAGSYQPLLATGTAAGHVCAFARHHGALTAIVAVPRLLTKLADVTAGGYAAMQWEDTAVPLPKSGTAWLDVFSGATFDSGPEMLQASELFAHFPVALLVNSADMQE